jgi:hypothetical protein
MKRAAFLALLLACGKSKSPVTKSYTVDGTKVTLTYPGSWDEHEIDKRTGAPELVPPDGKVLQGIAFDRVTVVTWPCNAEKPDAKTCLDEWVRMLYLDSKPTIEELSPEKRWIVSGPGEHKGGVDARLFVYVGGGAERKLVGCVAMLSREHASWLPDVRKVCESMTL